MSLLTFTKTNVYFYIIFLCDGGFAFLTTIAGSGADEIQRYEIFEEADI